MRKRVLLTITAALSYMGAMAQQTAYCEILNFGASVGSKAQISFDFGRDGFGDLVDESGKRIKFQGSVDALEYMSRLGWSLVSTYTLNMFKGTLNVPVVRFLLVKHTTSQDGKMNGIRTKEIAKKEKQPTDDGYGY